MAQKILGYIQLIWTCPFCETQNPGAIKSCTSCGAPQPDDIQFEKVDLERFDFIKDEALIRMAQTGPDKHCPYCGTRNLKDDPRCSQCGSDITVGAKVRESGTVIGDTPVVPTTTPRKLSIGCLIALILISVLSIFLLITFVSNLSTRETVKATVSSTKWERSIQVLAFTNIQKSDWEDQIPSNADIGSCSMEFRYKSDSPVSNSTEVCGEPYTIDTGTGVGKVVQDCVYNVYDNYCEYSTEDWVLLDTMVLTGYDQNPQWPTKFLASNEKYGNQNEIYTIFFDANGDTFSLNTTDLDLYLQAVPGSNWELEINGFGNITDLYVD